MKFHVSSQHGLGTIPIGGQQERPPKKRGQVPSPVVDSNSPEKLRGERALRTKRYPDQPDQCQHVIRGDVTRGTDRWDEH
ncbi:MAG TPA: hypothetical protein VK249_33590 [Anaerolineales bacterium]|nr:hypothetical protein [Anaerolineales bacterium]